MSSTPPAKVATEPERSRIWRWIGPIAALAVFGAVAYVLHREIASLHIRDIFRELRSIPTIHIIAALLITALSYWVLSFYDLLGLRYLRKTLPYARMVFTSFIAYAFGHNLGLAAFTGAAIRMRLYASAGLTAIDVVTVQGFCSLTSAIGLATLGGLSLLLEPQQLHDAVRLPLWWTRIVGTALLCLVVAYAVCSIFVRKPLEVRGWQLRIPRPSISFPQIALGLLDLGIASTVLYVLLPESASINYLAFLGVYAAAVTAGIISHVPGGIGVFETVIILAIPQVSCWDRCSFIAACTTSCRSRWRRCSSA
jgi:phosphatidylglycerol lysyltransferase